jgi:adenylate cyclase
MRMLNTYLADAIDEILEGGGMIDKILGDGLMALFNAPLDQEDHVMAGARAALAMQRRLRALRTLDGEPIQIGVGVSTGEAIVGNIGNTDIMNYTAIGDVVNVAARLQGDARAGEILLSGPAYQAISDRVEVEKLGPVYVKGRAEPVPVFKLLQVLD